VGESIEKRTEDKAGAFTGKVQDFQQNAADSFKGNSAAGCAQDEEGE
jgi:hypothetical protein